MNIFFNLYMKLDHSECNVANGKRLFAYIIDWFFRKSLYTASNVFTMDDVDKRYGNDGRR